MSTVVINRATRKLTAAIDAGIEHFTIEVTEQEKGLTRVVHSIKTKNNESAETVLKKAGITDLLFNPNVARREIYITGKLAEVVKDSLGSGRCVMPSASLWQAGIMLLGQPENSSISKLGIIEISASGYTVVCVNRGGKLEDGLLAVNPHCGAGTGINMNRVLQKLDISHEDVDTILKDYIGPDGMEKRKTISPRADRCGVFSSSATVSDKNQGIPLDFALATTIKSEVLKACRKMTSAAQRVYLTGGIFRWQFARNCASDYLNERLNITETRYDTSQDLPLRGTIHLADTIGIESFRNPEKLLAAPKKFKEYPSFESLKKRYSYKGMYLRSETVSPVFPDPSINEKTVNLALDVGSTMAKAVITDSNTGIPLWIGSLNNHGDTVETIKEIFRRLQSMGIYSLNLQNIGITGSGRYQVQKVLNEVYPHLQGRIDVLVENYAHARGSIREARARISQLRHQGIEVNEETAVLVDVGGEDTKISLISLADGDLTDNAMNIKCSAGTGSLMDTLKTLFGIASIEEACKSAQHALRAFNINATCAVFLMENASRMRAEGFPADEILASCYWAIVENMARTLWSQVEIPENPLVLLHGQTMLSDPLPLAALYRLQKFTGTPVYGLIPAAPGHRACIGLESGMDREAPRISQECRLEDFISKTFEKKIITCRGAACGDKNSRCNRVKLTFYSQGKKPQNIQLGGCSAVNELFAKRKTGKKDEAEFFDAYKSIWEHINSRLPRSEDTNRVILPRSFAASEQAFLISTILKHTGIPVHIDTVQAEDIPLGQKFFELDACAPNIGATGQMQRLASSPHGMILVPQIDFLATNGKSLGRTCTVNQGGPVIAMQFAKQEYPEADFLVFDLDLSSMDPVSIAAQLYHQWKPLYKHFGREIGRGSFLAAVTAALKECEHLGREVSDIVVKSLEYAIRTGKDIAIACGREYVLTPGVYDSHIGRLFRDKGVVAIPSYVLDVSLDQEFSHIYWKNPHHIISVVNAVKEKKLSKCIRDPRQSELFSRIEQGETFSVIGLSMVSTFTCGPDSITLPLIQELTRSIPFILVQSDGAIKELAHLENRINTFLRQITAGTAVEIGDASFTIGMLDRFAPGTLDKDRDVIYFPTLADNRTVTSVVRAAGFTCIDNYDDDTYDPEELIREGRMFAGDSVCAPFAGVYGDVLRAVEDFKARKARGELEGKNRIYIFNNKGSGPCRQGQYYEMHRLLLNRQAEKPADTDNEQDVTVKYLVALESRNYDIGLPEWAAVQGFQGLVMQGLLQGIYLKGGQQCKSVVEFREFESAFKELKQNIFNIFENTEPSMFVKGMVKKADLLDRATGSFLKTGKIARYFGYGLYHNNGLRTVLESFSNQWLKRDKYYNPRISIHADGEAYMRIALTEGVFRTLADSLGFGNFEFTSTPLWSYAEYLPEETARAARKELKLLKEKLTFTSGWKKRHNIRKAIQKAKKTAKQNTGAVKILRKIIAEPLYKAAGVEMPHPMKRNLKLAEAIVPTGKPQGELLPYIGESLVKLREGTDLILNVAPSGCMVSTMGGIIHPAILRHSNRTDARMQTLQSQYGDIDIETLECALLKKLGPVDYYKEEIMEESIKGIAFLEDEAAPEKENYEITDFLAAQI